MPPVRRLAIGLVALVVLVGLYGGTAALRAGRPHLLLPTPLDDLVPFAPAATLAYMWIVPQAMAPLAVLEDERALARAAVGLVGMVASFVPAWLLLPVGLPRVDVPVTDLFTWGVALARHIDPPVNCFPSAHVAEALYTALVVRRADRPVGDALLAGAAAVAWSTLALRQHWVLDVLVGGGAAVVAERLAMRGLPADALRAGPRRRLVWLAAVYAVLFAVAAGPWLVLGPRALELLWDPPW